jgi:alpha-D-ribose 1-methylphosphonate 5-triphosphate synthase subunit PhnH
MVVAEVLAAAVLTVVEQEAPAHLAKEIMAALDITPLQFHMAAAAAAALAAQVAAARHPRAVTEARGIHILQ